jgi:hypothetical protein
MLSKEDQSSLLDMAWHWEAAYTFSVIEGVWQAVPAADPSAVLTADTAEELRQKVRQDTPRARPARGPSEASARRRDARLSRQLPPSARSPEPGAQGGLGQLRPGASPWLIPVDLVDGRLQYRCLHAHNLVNGPAARRLHPAHPAHLGPPRTVALVHFPCQQVRDGPVGQSHDRRSPWGVFRHPSIIRYCVRSVKAAPVSATRIRMRGADRSIDSRPRQTQGRSLRQLVEHLEHAPGLTEAGRAQLVSNGSRLLGRSTGGPEQRSTLT